jgi:hypothetical protein
MCFFGVFYIYTYLDYMKWNCLTHLILYTYIYINVNENYTFICDVYMFVKYNYSYQLVYEKPIQTHDTNISSNWIEISHQLEIGE